MTAEPSGQAGGLYVIAFWQLEAAQIEPRRLAKLAFGHQHAHHAIDK
ncbi:MAG: hypothetical protein Q7S58_20435 [Candidatus Binatus sp.]|nr:hypothetical protein [Candidatus Binatus sp.]MDO8434772.1 hypothetical protein [Candidatus Binatus sp.]